MWESSLQQNKTLLRGKLSNLCKVRLISLKTTSSLGSYLTTIQLMLGDAVKQSLNFRLCESEVSGLLVLREGRNWLDCFAFVVGTGQPNRCREGNGFRRLGSEA